MAQYEPKLILCKETQNTCAVVGQTLIYSIHATNEDLIPFTNVVIYDVLDTPLIFKEGSVKVEGFPLPEVNISAGVPIGTLLPGEHKIITFEAKVLNRGHCVTVNQATAEFHYQLAGGPVIEAQVYSNIWEVKLYLADLEVSKKTNKEEVNLGDEITYTVKIKNRGDLVAKGVRLVDILPPQIRLIEGSVRVEGHIVNGVELEKGILIGKILPLESAIIQYKAKVVRTNCSSVLTNHASVTFRYELPCGSAEVLVGKPIFVTTYTKLNINTFKQLSIESYLCLPEVKPSMEALNVVTGTIDIKSCHVVATPQVVSEERQVLTGHKLVIHGILNAVVEYTALEPRQSVHSAHYSVPFSTFVILPPDYTIGSKLEIEGTVEDIYYQTMDVRCFFINATALINVKILGC